MHFTVVKYLSDSQPEINTKKQIWKPLNSANIKGHVTLGKQKFLHCMWAQEVTS